MTTKALWTLTVKEKTLLHLYDFFPPSNTFEKPFVLTQDGIAKIIGIMRSAVPRAMKELISEGLIVSELCHVKGLKRRRKCYFLTPAGNSATRKMVNRLKDVEVGVEASGDDHGGSFRVPLGKCSEVLNKKTRLIDLICVLEKKGVIDASDLERKSAATDTRERKRPQAPKERKSPIPAIRYFFGREKEMEEISSAFADGYRFVVVYGIAGIGKTTLSARFAEKKNSPKNVFWHRFYSWDDRQSILMELGEFLEGMGLPELANIMSRSTARANFSVIGRTLTDMLKDTRIFFVLDDFHLASQDIVELMVMLKNQARSFRRSRFLILSREQKKFYDVRDTLVKKNIWEMELAGLDESSIEQLYRAVTEVRPERKDLQSLMKLSKGHPLAVELMGARKLRDGAFDGTEDMEDFLENEIFSRLEQSEEEMLRFISITRTPMNVDCVFFDRTLALVKDELVQVQGNKNPFDWSTLTSLLSKNLVIRDGKKIYAHDVITEFFSKRSQGRSLLAAHKKRASFLFNIINDKTGIRARDDENKDGRSHHLTSKDIDAGVSHLQAGPVELGFSREEEDSFIAFFHHLKEAGEPELLAPAVLRFKFFFPLIFREEELGKLIYGDYLADVSAGDRWRIHSVLGDINASLDNDKKAITFYNDSLSGIVEEKCGDRAGLEVSAGHSDTASGNGFHRAPELLSYLTEHREDFSDESIRHSLVLGLKLGRIRMKNGEWEEAGRLFEAGSELSSLTHSYELKADYLAAEGWTHHHLGELGQAKKDYDECLSTLVGCTGLPGALRKNLSLARESAERGYMEEAMGYFDICMNYFEKRKVEDPSVDVLQHVGDHFLKMLFTTYFGLSR